MEIRVFELKRSLIMKRRTKTMRRRDMIAKSVNSTKSSREIDVTSTKSLREIDVNSTK